MKDETYVCKDCYKEIRKKAVANILFELKLCPQCYTKEVNGKPKRRRK